MTDTPEIELPKIAEVSLGDDQPRGSFTPRQVAQLLGAINKSRVLQAQGHSHVSQQDIVAHLIRVFGFGSFDVEVLDASLVFEQARQAAGKYDVCYRALVRLSIRNPDGVLVTRVENGSTATAQNQSRGDGHDLAYKSAISLSVKRAAIFLGDQFGLSLYNKGQLAPLVKGTLVGGPEKPKDSEDVQDGVEQQVSLGNDEVDRPMALEDDGKPPAAAAPAQQPSSPPAATAKPNAVGKAPAGWRQKILAAGDVPSLMKIYEQATEDGWYTEDVEKALAFRKDQIKGAPAAEPTAAQEAASGQIASGFNHPQAQQ